MTNIDMTHDAFDEQLMAFLEGDLDGARHTAMERHAENCARCGGLLADLRELRVEASKLPELSPSRDLWAGISARIEAPVVPIASVTPVNAFPAARRPVWQRRWVRRTAFAASLVAAVGVGYIGAMRTQDAALPGDAVFAGDTLLAAAMARDTSDSTATTPAPGSIAARYAVATLAADYDREIARLRALVDQRRNQMDPVTVAVIEKNLTVIDSAIADSKRAIARDPASRFLIESLNASLESKVELLRIAAALPNRS